MTATYNQVSIGSTDYNVYAAIATADEYLEAEVSAAATKWRDATQTDSTAKARALVTATRLIDRQNWPGSKTDEYQELDWPRTGTGITDVEDDVVPQDIIDACILVAADTNNGVDVTGSASTDTRQKRLKAGSVEIEYFRDLSGGTRFPTAIQELLAKYLAGGVSLAALSLAYGADTTSDFEDDYSPSGPL